MAILFRRRLVLLAAAILAVIIVAVVVGVVVGGAGASSSTPSAEMSRQSCRVGQFRPPAAFSCVYHTNCSILGSENSYEVAAPSSTR
jgi:hypothetical protein